MKNNIAIDLINISKRFYLRHEKPTFTDYINPLNKRQEFWALKNINLTIHKGEKIALIGPNGAGKTTLLEIIAGITTPTTGSVHTFGKIVSLIELGAGFHPDLTGKENIFLNGLLLGMSQKEVKSKLDKIIAFADIGHFIDSPFYTYSSGMALRLGFSTAIYSDPEILVLDENLHVGDKDFVVKAKEKLDHLFRQEKTIILASHEAKTVKDIAQKVILLNKGKIVKSGDYKKITNIYKLY